MKQMRFVPAISCTLPVEICDEAFTITLAQIIEISLVNAIKTGEVAHINRLKCKIQFVNT